MPRIFASIEPYRALISVELKSFLPQEEPLFDIIRYHLGLDKEGDAGGKLLRPILCLLACKALGGNPALATPLACSLELIHNCFLIHDDVEDESPIRRHRPTVWKVWGKEQAINAGDATYALAYLSLLRLQQKGISPKKLLQIESIFTEACLKVCQGQYLDVAFERETSISREDYMRMALGKTATLFETALHLGAMISGGKKREIDYLCRFGRNAGVSFQIQDDSLALWGKETGKVSPDILQKKKTFPVVWAIEQRERKERDALLRLYSKERLKEEDITQILTLLDQLDAKTYCQKIADEYYSRALEELEGSGLPTTAQQEFKDVLNFMRRREY